MWKKRFIYWVDNGTVYVSIPFTWDLPKAYSACVFFKSEGYEVKAGGPAVKLMPEQMGGYVSNEQVDALCQHNPDAVFTSRGCIRQCEFCAVPKIEGDLLELDNWTPKPIICDNNLLACSKMHFDKVIDSLKGINQVDFNQGLDARLLTMEKASRLVELDLRMVRLAWDYIEMESRVRESIATLTSFGIPKSMITVFCLIGFKDTPDDALYRLQSIKDLGLWPFAMRYQPLKTLVKNKYIGENWTKRELLRFSRYWNRQIWLKNIPFEEYRK